MARAPNRASEMEWASETLSASASAMVWASETLLASEQPSESEKGLAWEQALAS